MKMHGSKEMYANSPKFQRGEDGKMGVSKKSGPTEAEKVATEENGEVGGMPVHEHEMMGRHNLDRHMLHAKHEHEHAMHKGEGKEEMHSRHHKEMGDLHKRHESEMGSGREDMMGKAKDIMGKGE